MELKFSVPEKWRRHRLKLAQNVSHARVIAGGAATAPLFAIKIFSCVIAVSERAATVFLVVARKSWFRRESI